MSLAGVTGVARVPRLARVPCLLIATHCTLIYIVLLTCSLEDSFDRFKIALTLGYNIDKQISKQHDYCGCVLYWLQSHWLHAVPAVPTCILLIELLAFGVVVGVQ